MSKGTRSDTTTTSTATAVKSSTEAITADERAQGFRGTGVDSTPNEHYTVAGVTSGKPTPETDHAQAKKVREESGIGLSPIEASAREKEAAAAGKERTAKLKGVK
jgi:hypothetical protein